MRRLPLFVISTLMLAVPGLAHAHIAMTSPTPRTSEQKQPNCGLTGSVRGATAAVFRPGETITVTWNETVNHSSHYRIAFDADGDDDFVSPAGRDDLYNSPAVLVDMIADRNGGGYSQEITLPDTECENCTIQLIQIMYGSGNYFQCADIAIRSGAPGVDGGPVVETDGGSAGSDSGVPGTDGGVRPRTDGGSTPPPGTTSGCGCRVARPASDEGSAAALFSLLGVGALLGRRGRRRARARSR